MKQQCPTGLIAYRSRRQARSVLAALRRLARHRRRRTPTEDHPVWCPICLHWHLTWSGRRP